MSDTQDAFLNLVYLTAAKGQDDKLRDVMLGTVGAALASPGNQGFSIHQSTGNPADFLIVERWENDRALHQGTHSAALAKALTETQDQDLVQSGPSGSRWTKII